MDSETVRYTVDISDCTDKEIQALVVVYAAISDLGNDDAAKKRVLNWCLSRVTSEELPFCKLS